MDASQVLWVGKGYPLKRAKATLTKNTTTQIVAAVTGKKIGVFGMVLSSSDGVGLCAVALSSNATAISAAHTFGTVPIVCPPAPWPYWITTAAEALKAAESLNNVDAVIDVLYAELE